MFSLKGFHPPADLWKRCFKVAQFLDDGFWKFEPARFEFEANFFGLQAEELTIGHGRWWGGFVLDA